MSWQTEQMLREIAPLAAVLLLVIAFLWWIFPYLPDHPPKKKR